MKNILHLFSREVVSAALESNDHKSGKNFEFMAALMMQRLYGGQWNAPTMIGFYMNTKYAALLASAGNPSNDLLIDSLKNGIDENKPIDFAISTSTEEGGNFQEFQLKRFGMKGQKNDTGGLVEYLNDMKNRYAPVDACCLVALTDIESIDLPRVNREVEKESFPFTEVLLVGVVSDKFLVAGILPEEGWGAYDLHEVVC